MFGVGATVFATAVGATVFATAVGASVFATAVGAMLAGFTGAEEGLWFAALAEAFEVAGRGTVLLPEAEEAFEADLLFEVADEVFEVAGRGGTVLFPWAEEAFELFVEEVADLLFAEAEEAFELAGRAGPVRFAEAEAFETGCIGGETSTEEPEVETGGCITSRLEDSG